MNAKDLERALYADAKASPLFEGVFPRDVAASVIRRRGPSPRPRAPRLYVFNTHRAGLPGEHWIAVAVRGDRAAYFDSYGRHPRHYPAVASALLAVAPVVEWNSRWLQGLTTTACGDYCLWFCLLAARGWSLRRFVARLDRFDSSEDRDHALRALTVRLLGEETLSYRRNNRPRLIELHDLHVKDAVALVGFI